MQEATYNELVSIVGPEYVSEAVEERFFRHNLPDERIRELIEQGTLMIDVDGAVVGQVNGLSVGCSPPVVRSIYV